MKKIFCGSFLLISMLSPLIVSAKTVEHIIYQYAELIDTRKFDELQTIMWEDFKMTGGYEINGLSGFLGAMQQLASTYDSTMHFIGNIDGNWSNDVYKGKTYCVASHIYSENGIKKKLDMGIVYEDTIVKKDGFMKFSERRFNLIWSNVEEIF